MTSQVYKHYGRKLPASAFWQPKPGEPVAMKTFTAYTPFTTGQQDALTAAWKVDYPRLEERLLMTMTEWNTPHVCYHEGPWTLRSCRTCDINEAKAIVALIAWLTGRQDVLDLLKPRWVHCMHPGASLYEQCPTCRWELWKLNEAGHDLLKIPDHSAWVNELLRADAKRASFGAALGPYGGV